MLHSNLDSLVSFPSQVKWNIILSSWQDYRLASLPVRGWKKIGLKASTAHCLEIQIVQNGAPCTKFPGQMGPLALL